ncbi:MAG TPA: glutathione S-transferase family protein [Candidatus Binatia bacterium]|jgi:glutathione S-transferase|nr:glutathione S-transferase family protein [Candidatus Binatia bacterium]
MAIILYGNRLSPFVEKVHRGLMLKQIPFQQHEPHSLFDLRRNNPTTGKMPALDLNGQRLFDSTLILRALDEFKPEPPLLSADPQIAAQQRLLEDWADESLYWYGMVLRWNVPANAARTIGLIAKEVPSIVRPLIKAMAPRSVASQTRAQGLGRLPLDILLRELDGHLTNLVQLLGEGPFFFGASQPSIADLAVFAQLGFLYSPVTPEGTAAVEQHPELLEFCQRLDAMTD